VHSLVLASLLCCAIQGKAPLDPTLALRDLLGIPYVNDAVLDEKSRWTTFTHPDQALPAPALNCSGFVLAAARRLLGYSGTLDQATRDRLGDSDKEAKNGRDWDFAWDLVMNLSEGHQRRVILPTGEAAIEDASGLTLRGFAMDDAEAWKLILPRLRQGCVYLCSLSRIAKGGHVQHYHAVLLLRDAKGAVWLYQTLPLGRSHRLNLTSEQGFERMLEMFDTGKRILMLEVETDASPKR